MGPGVKVHDLAASCRLQPRGVDAHDVGLLNDGNGRWQASQPRGCHGSGKRCCRCHAANNLWPDTFSLDQSSILPPFALRMRPQQNRVCANLARGGDNAGGARYRSASEEAGKLYTKGAEWHCSGSAHRVKCGGLGWLQSCSRSKLSMFMAAFLSWCIPMRAPGPGQHLLEQMRTWCTRSEVPDWP